MGRGRLRRGCSLEVIFEEDPDFCSHLDSLDAAAFRIGRNAHDEISVDSLFEDYHLVCRAENEDRHFFRSLDGLIDLRVMDSCFVEWDEFTTDSMGKIEGRPEVMLPPTSSLIGANLPENEIPPSGRRSRVSRRQIVEASWILDSSDSSNDNDSTGPDNDMLSDNGHTGRSLVTSVDDFSGDTQLPIYSMQIPIQNPPQLPAFARICTDRDKDTLDSYVSTMTDDTDTNTYAFADPYDDVTSVASSTFDSSGSTSSTTSSTGSVCTVNGVKRDRTTPTNLSATHENLHGSITSITISNASPSLLQDSDSLNTDVKKVRALFEISSKKLSCEDYADSYNGSVAPSRNSMKKTHSDSCSSISSGSNSSSPSSGVINKLKQNQKNFNCMNNGGNYSKCNSGGSSPSGKLRSAYSQFSLNHITTHERPLDLVDLLVNENVVIEDSPDIFQTLRNRHRDNPTSKGSTSSSCSNSSTNTNETTTTAGNAPPGSSSSNSTLRRSKSMGAGISKIGDESSSPSSSSENINGLRRSCILAAEMPAPDTVKNVRTVFEKMLTSRSKSTKKNAAAAAAEGSDSVDGALMGGIGFSSEKSSFDINSNSHHGFKKSLRSVKSNPSSKIFRSESVRLENNDSTMGRRYGKPILIKDNIKEDIKEHSTGVLTKSYDKSLSLSSINSNTSSTPSPQRGASQPPVKRLVERKLSEPIRFNPKIGCSTTNGFRPRDGSLSEEELSLLCSLTDDNQPKLVPPDVLQRIRSCGTTTTYFGGQIVAKTVKNRKLPVTRRHTVDFQDYYSSNSGLGNAISEISSGGSFPATPTNTFRNEIDSPNYYGPEGFSVCENFSIGSSSATSPSLFSSVSCSSGHGTTKSSSGSPTSVSASSASTTVTKPGGLQQDYRTAFHLPLESIYSAAAAAMMKADSVPRIISVLPKSQSSSPTKSSSPVGSIIEGRNSPEGCESNNDNCHTRSEWINEIPLSMSTSAGGGGNSIERPVSNNKLSPSVSPQNQKQDGNNNSIPITATVNGNCVGTGLGGDKKFSQIEGAWF